MGIAAGLEIAPLTDARWLDLVDLFGPRGADAGCWCMFFRVSSKDWSWTGDEGNRAALHALAGSDPAPGLLAYADGQAVGWVGLGPRTTFERLNRSRKYPPLDELSVWSVVCFFVRRAARSGGVADALLSAAVAYARDHADGVEGYAVEPQGRISPADAYHGTVGMFERAGFRRARKATSPGGRHDRWIMRLEFKASSGPKAVG